HAPQTWLFITSCIAVVPLASALGQATEELAKRMGAQVGALLSATFGNAVELIVCINALHFGMVVLVRATLVGSVIGNICLVLGLSIVAGGMRFKIQHFDQDVAQSHSI